MRQLEPIYWRSRLDIAIGYAALIAALVLISVGQAAGLSLPMLVIGGSVWVGYWFFYLVSFLHEGVHWNLAKSRKVNDLSCNVLLTWLIGVNLSAYRQHHFEHHRSLGTVHDSQTSYFSPLNLSTILKSLLGVRAVQGLWAYLKRSSERERKRSADIEPASITVITRAMWLGLILGAAVHGLIVGALWLSGAKAAALSWAIGVGIVMPFLNTLRQVLEHRHEDAQVEVDYSTTDQGACSRMFGTGLFDSTFGAAGANRHLLHHWEPRVSYTRLPDLERFLADTPMRIVMDRRRTTYFAALREFLSFS